MKIGERRLAAAKARRELADDLRAGVVDVAGVKAAQLVEAVKLEDVARWFLFVLLEVISFALLFRFNSYQGSAFFTSANRVAGAVYDAANNVTGYFHLKTINDELVQKNVELELQVERLREALTEATGDSSGIEQMKQEALQGYDIFKASVINNSITHADNYITINKGTADGVRA